MLSLLSLCFFNIFLLICFSQYSLHPIKHIPFMCSVLIFCLISGPSPGGSDDKESACHTGDLGWIPGLRRFPGEGNGSPLQDSCLENPHGQRSLVCYSPWGRKESDTTEQLRHTRFLEALGCDALFLWVFCFYYKFIFLKILFVIIICGLD